MREVRVLGISSVFGVPALLRCTLFSSRLRSDLVFGLSTFDQCLCVHMAYLDVLMGLFFPVTLNAALVLCAPRWTHALLLYAFNSFQLSATRHLNTDSDTELLSEIFGMELAARRPAIGPPVTRELLFQVVQVLTVDMIDMIVSKNLYPGGYHIIALAGRFFSRPKTFVCDVHAQRAHSVAVAFPAFPAHVRTGMHKW